jgi:hypothetical protein
MASSGMNPSDPLSGAGTTQTQGATETESGAEAAQREGEHLTDRARRKARELKRQAEDLAEDIPQRARSAVDEQKEAAVGGIEGVAHALRSASDDLRDRGQPVAAEYSLQVADGLESIANWVSRRNVDDVMGGIDDFARRRPVAFFGGALVAGFALARFMKSSSARRSRMSGSEYGVTTAGSYGRPTRTEYRGASTAAPGSRGQGMRTPHADTPSSASAGTSGGSYGRPPTEGGI